MRTVELLRWRPMPLRSLKLQSKGDWAGLLEELEELVGRGEARVIEGDYGTYVSRAMPRNEKAPAASAGV